MCGETHSVKDVQTLRRWLARAGVAFQDEDYMPGHEYARQLHRLVELLWDMIDRRDRDLAEIKRVYAEFREVYGITLEDSGDNPGTFGGLLAKHRRMRETLENFEIVCIDGGAFIVFQGKGHGCTGSAFIAGLDTVIGQGAHWLERQRRDALGLDKQEA